MPVPHKANTSSALETHCFHLLTRTRESNTCHGQRSAVSTSCVDACTASNKSTRAGDEGTCTEHTQTHACESECRHCQQGQNVCCDNREGTLRDLDQRRHVPAAARRVQLVSAPPLRGPSLKNRQTCVWEVKTGATSEHVNLAQDRQKTQNSEQICQWMLPGGQLWYPQS